MAFRKRVSNKRGSARRFRKTAMRTKRINTVSPMRGGIRL